MSVRTIATLAIAVVLGLIVVLMINGFLNNSHNTPVVQATTGKGSPVVVAALPITRGVALTPEMLKVVNYPADAAPLGAFGTINELAGGKDVQRVALRDLAPGEPVLSSRVSGPGGRLNLAGVITPGMQAIAVHMSDVLGVGGFVEPGERVDILLTRTAGGASGQTSTALTQILAENIRVLGIDQADDEENSKPTVVHTVTVEVTPEQAQLITLAQTVGTVSFSLRHVNDAQPQLRKATFMRQLGGDPPPPPPPPRPRPQPGLPMGPSIRVTRATETTVYQLSAR